MLVIAVLIHSVGLLDAAATVRLAPTVKDPVDAAEPADVVTLMVPVVPAPTVAVICVGLSTVKDCAAVPPKLTAVTPV